MDLFLKFVVIILNRIITQILYLLKKFESGIYNEIKKEKTEFCEKDNAFFLYAPLEILKN